MKYLQKKLIRVINSGSDSQLEERIATPEVPATTFSKRRSAFARPNTKKTKRYGTLYSHIEIV